LATRLHGERFIVVGDGHGAYAEQFRDLVSQADGAIEVTGYLPRHDISGVLARSDFLVLPSGLEDDDVRENFGNVVAESLASGRPALVSAGLAWDFLESEGLGMLLDKSNIADVIARARSMPADAYAHMCRMARHYAETNLDIEVAADKLWSIMMTASASD
jgi:glycosyltransferase involved in cell wall biosynthesis